MLKSWKCRKVCKRCNIENGETIKIVKNWKMVTKFVYGKKNGQWWQNLKMVKNWKLVTKFENGKNSENGNKT